MPTASTRQDRDRVVDARDHEQDPLRHEPELRPFLGRDQRRTAVIIPIPMNETEATSSTTIAAR